MRHLRHLLSSFWRSGALFADSSLSSRARRLIPIVSGAVLVGSFALYRPDLRLPLASSPRVAAAERPHGPSHVNFIADVVEKVLPAVVYIETGHRFGFRASSGSGFIFREDGFILTNFHVVGSNSSVKVRISDDRTLTGRVIAANPALDLALVKVPAKDLPFIELGRSSALRTGEWVIALGAPRFLTNSVTVGVVSATDRDLGIQRGQRYIQTDAAITHGNSGGPLVNVDGQVVGINTMKLEAGIGFAIPADDVQKFVASTLGDLDRRGSSIIERLWPSQGSSSGVSDDRGKRQAYIGVNMMTLQHHILEDLRRMMPGFFDGVTQGVMVHSVNPGSPASQAGLAQFDVIVSMNGIPINSAKEVYSVFDKLPVEGDIPPVQIEVLRRGMRLKISVKPEVMEVYR